MLGRTRTTLIQICKRINIGNNVLPIDYKEVYAFAATKPPVNLQLQCIHIYRHYAYLVRMIQMKLCQARTRATFTHASMTK